MKTVMTFCAFHGKPRNAETASLRQARATVAGPTLRRSAFWIALLLAPTLATAQVAPPDAEAENTPPADAAPAISVDETPEERLERLFRALAEAEGDEADAIADQITAVWARSGSASMDLLLQRTRKATNDEDYDKARAHVSALTRLAPEFAEGWNASATLYFIQEDYWLSVEHIQKTLELEPRHFGALAGLAIILERVDRKEASLRTWERVKALFPGMERAQEAIDRLKPEVDGKKT